MGAHSPNFNHVVGEVKILLMLNESKRMIFSVASMQQFGAGKFAYYAVSGDFRPKSFRSGQK
jgi:hypothetical protein